MDDTKMKQSYCELILPTLSTLVQTVTFSSPSFKDTDNVTNGISGDSFYVDVIWDIRL